MKSYEPWVCGYPGGVGGAAAPEFQALTRRVEPPTARKDRERLLAALDPQNMEQKFGRTFAPYFKAEKMKGKNGLTNFHPQIPRLAEGPQTHY